MIAAAILTLAVSSSPSPFFFKMTPPTACELRARGVREQAAAEDDLGHHPEAQRLWINAAQAELSCERRDPKAIARHIPVAAFDYVLAAKAAGRSGGQSAECAVRNEGRRRIEAFLAAAHPKFTTLQRSQAQSDLANLTKDCSQMSS